MSFYYMLKALFQRRNGSCCVVDVMMSFLYVAPGFKRKFALATMLNESEQLTRTLSFVLRVPATVVSNVFLCCTVLSNLIDLQLCL
jgi:hypothetical protein